jgi:hypothetical protein
MNDRRFHTEFQAVIPIIDGSREFDFYSPRILCRRDYCWAMSEPGLQPCRKDGIDNRILMFVNYKKVVQPPRTFGSGVQSA